MLFASDLRSNACFEATDGLVKGHVAEDLARAIHECRPGRTTGMRWRLRLRSGGGLFYDVARLSHLAQFGLEFSKRAEVSRRGQLCWHISTLLATGQRQ